MHSDESKPPVPVRSGEGSTSAPELMEVSDNKPSKDIDKVYSILLDSAVMLGSALYDNGGKVVSVDQFCRQSNQADDIVTNVDQITEVRIHGGRSNTRTNKGSGSPFKATDLVTAGASALSRFGTSNMIVILR